MLKTALALALVALLAEPAAADVLFTFTQTGSTPPGAVSATGTLTISDEAHAAGLDVAREFPGLAPNDLSGTGIVDLSFTANQLTATFSDFTIGDQIGWEVVLSSDPFGTPSGLIRFNDNESDFLFSLDGVASEGLFNSDTGPCFITGTCSFTGIFARAAPTPAPAALSLIALGTLALGAARRRRRA